MRRIGVHIMPWYPTHKHMQTVVTMTVQGSHTDMIWTTGMDFGGRTCCVAAIALLRTMAPAHAL